MFGWREHYNSYTKESDSKYVKKAERAMKDVIDWNHDIHMTERAEIDICAKRVVEIARELEENNKNIREWSDSGDAPDVEVSPKDLALVVFAAVAPGRRFLEEKSDNLGLNSEEWIYIHDSV